MLLILSTGKIWGEKAVQAAIHVHTCSPSVHKQHREHGSVTVGLMLTIHHQREGLHYLFTYSTDTYWLPTWCWAVGAPRPFPQGLWSLAGGRRIWWLETCTLVEGCSRALARAQKGCLTWLECGACTEKATLKLHLTAMLCHWSAHCGFWSLTG